MAFQLVRIRDLCDVTSSKRIFANQYVENGVPFYRSREIIEKNSGKEDLSEPLFIEENVYQQIAEKFGVPQDGDMLLTSVGTLGIPYIVKKETFYFKDGNLTWFRNFKNKTTAKYLFYWFSSRFGHENLVFRAIGSSQPALTIDILKKHKVLVPDIDEQKAIVACLEKYDLSISNNNNRIKSLETMIGQIYKEWFLRFRFPGFEKIDMIGGVPENWSYSKFSDVFSSFRGVSYSSEEIDCYDGQNLINLKNIKSYGGFRRDGTKQYNGKFKKEQVVNYKDLVMGVTDMTQERRTVGAVALIPNIKGIISADLIKLVSPINNIFSYCMFRFGSYSKLFSQFGNGANVIHLKPSSISNQKMLIPPENLIDQFVKIVEPMIDLVEMLNVENDNLLMQRDMLLPRLMSGELNVSGKEII